MGVTLVRYCEEPARVRAKFSGSKMGPVGVLFVSHSGKGAEIARPFFHDAKIFDGESICKNPYGKVCGWIPEAEIEKSFENKKPVIICLSGERSCQHKWRHITIRTLERLGAKTTVVYFVNPPLKEVVQEILYGHMGLKNLFWAIWLKMLPPTEFGVDYLIKS